MSPYLSAVTLRLTRGCSLTGFLIGLAGWMGWVLEVPALKRIHPALVPMKANTALGLMAAGVALALLERETVRGARRALGAALGWLIAGLGAVTLLEYGVGRDLGIDLIFFNETQEQAGYSVPGRMGVASATVFVCLGLGLALIDTRVLGKYRASRLAILAAVATSFVTLYYFFGIQEGESIMRWLTIALHTVVAFYALAAGVCLSRPDRGLVKSLFSRQLGGVAARRMLPAALVLPILLGWLTTLGRTAGWFGPGFAMAALVVLIILALMGLIWWTVRAINRQEKEVLHTREELAKSEATLRDFVDHATIGLQWVGPDGRIVWANEAQLDLMGYSRAEYIGMRCADLHVDPAAFERCFERLVQGESLREFDAVMIRKDGERRDVLMDSNGRFEEGKFLHTRCFTRDVTASRIGEAAQGRLAAIVDSSDVAIVGKDLQGVITSWNKGAEKVFGYTPEEAVGRPLVMLMPRGRQKEETVILAKIASGERVGAFESVRVRKDGTEIFISATVSPIKDREGRVIGASKVAQDITARKRAELSLRESEERARLATEATGVGIWEWNTRTGMLKWDAQMFRMYGLTASPDGMVAYEDWRKRVMPEDLAEQERILNETVATGNRSFREFRIHRQGDGLCRYIQSVETVRADTEGRTVWVVGTNLDITERKQAEADLLESHAKVQAASRAKDDFLAALSHELRTPLTPVLMTATALEHDASLTDDVRETLGMMRRNIELEARLIDDLLDLTRISRGKLKIAQEPADLHQLLEHTAEIVTSDTFGKQVYIAFHPDAARCHALADPTRLQQVFWNLIKNALKFTPTGGHITVRTSNVDGPEWVTVTVQDDGIGIPASALPHIFNAFEQGDVSGQHRYGGLGLGLAISRAVMNAHEGGSLLAASEGTGKGALFTVRLPTIEAPAIFVRSDAASMPPVPGLRLLIVEDHETTRTVLAQLLTNRGHLVTTASTLQEGLGAFALDHFDVVISDLGLPDGSGLDLMREITRQRPVPAIALSGYGMEEDLRLTREAGFAAHLVKPVSIMQLRHLIDQITGGGKSGESKPEEA